MSWFATGEPPEYDVAVANIKVPIWPTAEGPRIDPRFRFNKGQYLPAPKPSQYFIRMRVANAPGQITYNAVLNLLAISDTAIVGSTGLSPEGYSLEFRWDLFDTPDPTFDVVGHKVTITYNHTGFPSFWISHMWGSDVPALYDSVEVPLLARKVFGENGFWKDTNYDPDVNTDVTIDTVVRNMYEWWPISE